MTIRDFRKKIENLKGRRDQVKENLVSAKAEAESLEREIGFSEEGQRIVQHVARLTQQQLEYRVSAPVSAALAGVFDNPYEFQLRFEVRRGQTEADLVFSRGESEYKDLVYSGGGGAVDVAAWGLQIAGWSMGKTRNFLLADEPLRFLKSKDKVLERRGALMIKEISHKVGLQILMISHIPEQQEGSDRVFDLSLIKGETHVKSI